VIEREIKAVVPDPAALAARLAAAGATPEFRGLMSDRRFDREGALMSKAETLRLRRFESGGEPIRAVLGWKGPPFVEGDAKLREEIEVEVEGDVVALLRALGYREVHALDRFVEVYRCGEATVRLEWYPRMDVLVEVEGPEPAIAEAVSILGLPRSAYSAEALLAFVARYQAAGGRPALSLVELGGDRPSWSGR
jgi:adenylate cyclase class IV